MTAQTLEERISKLTPCELGKYMIAELSELKPKTTVWKIYAKSSYAKLGTVRWFAPWRQYCFFMEPPSSTEASFIFSSSCLNQIRWFLIRLNQQQRKVKKP